MLTRRHAAEDQGFTLVELLVTMVIFGVVSAVVGASLIQGLQTSRRVQARTEVNQTATLALERLSRHARAAAPLIEVTSTTMRLENVESGVCREYTYTYSQASGEVTERTAPCTVTTATGVPTIATTSTRTLLRGIKNDPASAPLFVARDRAGSSTTASQAVSVELLAVVDPPEAPPFQVRTSVALRNPR